jgi:RNA polymerase sigma-70 factor (ECF subfamily)
MNGGGDEELYRRARAGETAAFELLYARYERPLFAFVFSHLHHQQDAEDVFHEAFLKALRVAPARLAPGGFRAWLYRIARNEALNRLRGRKTSQRLLTQLGHERGPDHEDVPGEPNRGRDQQLSRAVSRLPVHLAEVYRLRVSGLSYEEMAQVLEVPLGTLKSRMHDMVRRLKEEMERWTASESKTP